MRTKLKKSASLLYLWTLYFSLYGQQVQNSTDTLQQDIAWLKVSDSVQWRPRDSAGEVVFKNKMWILGGWLSSYESPPRDVWCSDNGSDWQKKTDQAPWKHGDFPITVIHKKKMWVMGGWYNGRLPDHEASNQVWSSKDGTQWEKVSDSAAWTPRMGSAIVSFRGKMWLMGGTENYYFGDSTSLKNDVWYSTNGKNWKLAIANAPWSPRAYHTAVVFDNKIWIMGGGNYVPKYHALNDVWFSEDGIHWTQVTEHASWSPRIWFSSIVYRNAIWILGGWSHNPSRNWNDVWYSIDGLNWKVLQSKGVWKPRHEHSTYVFKDKIWVAGGNTSPLVNDVWTLELPYRWSPQ